jgi:NTE family protein
MFAAWEVGVWRFLCDRVRPDIVVGASAGSWNGWAIAGGATPEDLAREWRDPSMAKLMQVGLHRSGWLRPEALYAKARELQARYRPKIPFGLTLVEAPRLRLRLVRDKDIEWRHLAAACSIPFSFPPVSIDGVRYVDGGLRGALPLWAAEEMGATRAIGVNCLIGLPWTLLRTVMQPRRTSGRLEVALIEPSRPLGVLRSAVFWSAENVERWMEEGARDAERAWAGVRW